MVLSNLGTDPLRASSVWRGLRKEPPPPSVTGDRRAAYERRRAVVLPGSTVGRRAALHLVAPVVGLLKDILGHLPAPQPEGYRCTQRHRAEHYQERGRRKLNCNAELGDGGEYRVDDNGVLRHARQETTPGRPPHYPRDEVRQECGQDQDQDRRYDGGYVGYQLP